MGEMQMNYAAKKFADFNLGDTSSFTKTITETDVVMFAGISGDMNPLHMDDEYAKTTQFKSRIAHGALVASLLGPAGASFFGCESVYMAHTQRFLAPVRIGDTITATVEVKEMIPEKKRIKTYSTCTNQHGALVVAGESLIKIFA
ncbi:MAG: MaoC family dehydratase [Peptococcaceae bacterium]|jgi:3-hydroxybutyryl-CoA dehydratase|nr:MaoC family dehydratase [Peptococcaceae bacterium]